MVGEDKKNNAQSRADEAAQFSSQGPSSSTQAHPYSSETVYFATHHEKDRLARTEFLKLGMNVQAIDIDSDRLGTFSGERERPGPIREVLRAKIDMGRVIQPEGRFFLASEGSFIPHPQIGFIRSNYESLMFVDTKESTEVFIEHISTRVVHEEFEAKDSSSASLDEFLTRNQFPSHALIVRPKGLFNSIYKGVQSRDSLEKAVNTCIEASAEHTAILVTDLRAHLNPTRQAVITETVEKLCAALNSFCPECSSPGYRIVNSLPGLPCQVCGEPSSQSKDVIFECPQCMLTRVEPRPDGITSISSEECAYCNP